MAEKNSPSVLQWRRLKVGPSQDFRVLTIREDLVADPRNGNEHRRVIIDCPDWVHVFARTKDEQIVFVRQFRFGIWDSTLEVPGGIVEKGEEPANAALRELEEETGYTAEQIRQVGFIHPNPAIQTNRCYTFVASGCVKTSAGKQDDGEDISVELHRVLDVPHLISSGQITHALIVAGFHLAQESLTEPGQIERHQSL